MKNKFIVGKWYKGFRSPNEIAAKFKEFSGKDDRYFRFSEYIRVDCKNIHEVYDGSWYNEPQLVECPLSEIFDYLPDGHPDKIKPRKVKDNLKPLKKLLDNMK